MLQITYPCLLMVISLAWCLVRILCAVKNKGVVWKNELRLLWVYICIIVVARLTFFPFFKVDGRIQPLVFDAEKMLPFRINLIPLVNLFDYSNSRDLILNVIGNTTMFVPVGVIWPAVFNKLNTHGKVVTAGVGFSLCIELLQIPFFDRVTDVDDLLLNTVGFMIGYCLFLIVRRRRRV